MYGSCIWYLPYSRSNILLHASDSHAFAFTTHHAGHRAIQLQAEHAPHLPRPERAAHRFALQQRHVPASGQPGRRRVHAAHVLLEGIVVDTTMHSRHLPDADNAIPFRHSSCTWRRSKRKRCDWLSRRPASRTAPCRMRCWRCAGRSVCRSRCDRRRGMTCSRGRWWMRRTRWCRITSGMWRSWRQSMRATCGWVCWLVQLYKFVDPRKNTIFTISKKFVF